MEKGVKPEDMATKVEKLVREAVNPRTEKIRVWTMPRTRNGKVFVECDSKDDISKLRNHDGLKEKGVEVSTSSVKLPQVIIYDLPSSETPERLKEMNADLLRVTDAERFKRSLNFKFKTEPKGQEVVNWVLEVSPQLRNSLVTAGKLYLGWSRCRVIDFVGLTRCYKCLRIGHIAVHCWAKTDTCTHCAQDAKGSSAQVWTLSATGQALRAPVYR